MSPKGRDMPIHLIADRGVMDWLGKHRKRFLLAGGYVIAAILLDLSSGAFVLQTGLAICYPPAGLYLVADQKLRCRTDDGFTR